MINVTMRPYDAVNNAVSIGLQFIKCIGSLQLPALAAIESAECRFEREERDCRYTCDDRRKPKRKLRCRRLVSHCLQLLYKPNHPERSRKKEDGDKPIVHQSFLSIPDRLPGKSSTH